MTVRPVLYARTMSARCLSKELEKHARLSSSVSWASYAVMTFALSHSSSLRLSKILSRSQSRTLSKSQSRTLSKKKSPLPSRRQGRTQNRRQGRILNRRQGKTLSRIPHLSQQLSLTQRALA